MSRLGIWLAESINRLVPAQAMHRQLEQDKLSVADYQAREYEEARCLCPEFGPHWDVRGKSVLDVGSGLGGKPLFYADQGASRVTAVDIAQASVCEAARLAEARRPARIRLVTADAAHLPFCADCFDVVVSINVFEHIGDVRQALAECKRVLRPGGLILLHFPPFYSPWGAHLEGWINFPWPHALFSDETLIGVAQRVEARRRNNARYIPSAQVDWAHQTQLPGLNRITASQFMRLIRQVELTVVESHMLPFGRHYLSKRGALARAGLAGLKALAACPLLREVLTTKMVFVLTKAKP